MTRDAIKVLNMGALGLKLGKKGDDATYSRSSTMANPTNGHVRMSLATACLFRTIPKPPKRPMKARMKMTSQAREARDSVL